MVQHLLQISSDAPVLPKLGADGGLDWLLKVSNGSVFGDAPNQNARTSRGFQAPSCAQWVWRHRLGDQWNEGDVSVLWCRVALPGRFSPLMVSLSLADGLNEMGFDETASNGT